MLAPPSVAAPTTTVLSPPLRPPSSTAASLHHRCLPPTNLRFSPTAASRRHCCPPLPLMSPLSVAAAIVARPHRPALSPHNSATFPRCRFLPPLLLCSLSSVIPPPSPLQPYVASRGRMVAWGASQRPAACHRHNSLSSPRGRRPAAYPRPFSCAGCDFCPIYRRGGHARRRHRCGARGNGGSQKRGGVAARIETVATRGRGGRLPRGGRGETISKEKVAINRATRWPRTCAGNSSSVGRAGAIPRKTVMHRHGYKGYCASHKNWIRNIRFSIMNRPLSQ